MLHPQQLLASYVDQDACKFKFCKMEKVTMKINWSTDQSLSLRQSIQYINDIIWFIFGQILKYTNSKPELNIWRLTDPWKAKHVEGNHQPCTLSQQLMFRQDHLAQHHKMLPRWDGEVLKGCRLPSRTLQSIGEERKEK